MALKWLKIFELDLLHIPVGFVGQEGRTVMLHARESPPPIIRHLKYSVFVLDASITRSRVELTSSSLLTGFTRLLMLLLLANNANQGSSRHDLCFKCLDHARSVR
jgi:hypothetical protein